MTGEEECLTDTGVRLVLRGKLALGTVRGGQTPMPNLKKMTCLLNLAFILLPINCTANVYDGDIM